jgi:hypothetical protein
VTQRLSPAGDVGESIVRPVTGGAMFALDGFECGKAEDGIGAAVAIASAPRTMFGRRRKSLTATRK